MFREGEAEPDLGLNVSVWTCARDCKLAPALCAQSKWLAGVLPFFSLALISCPLNCDGSASGRFS